MPYRFAIAGVLIILSIYGLVKALPLILGPEIRVDPITVNADDGFMTLSGRSLHTETLTLDGSTLLIDESGHFSKTLALPHGGVTITLRANDRFGRATSITKEIVAP